MLVKYSRELCKVWEVDLLQITLCVFVLLCFCLFPFDFALPALCYSKSFYSKRDFREEVRKLKSRMINAFIQVDSRWSVVYVVNFVLEDYALRGLRATNTR